MSAVRSMTGSKSSMTSQPPGLSAAFSLGRMAAASGTCTKTWRAWMRSKALPGSASRTILWRRISTLRLPLATPSRKRGSMSVTTTAPPSPTLSDSQADIDPPPAPISRQVQPAATPNFSKHEMVAGSHTRSRYDRRSELGSRALSNT